jgi:excisionase family DNA binding protein
MSEPEKPAKPFQGIQAELVLEAFGPLLDRLADKIAQRISIKSAPKEDRLLTVEQVCEFLNVTEEWVYHNAKKLPFVRKVGGMLRFSANGLQRYIEATKFTVKD